MWHLRVGFRRFRRLGPAGALQGPFPSPTAPVPSLLAMVPVFARVGSSRADSGERRYLSLGERCGRLVREIRLSPT